MSYITISNVSQLAAHVAIALNRAVWGLWAMFLYDRVRSWIAVPAKDEETYLAIILIAIPVFGNPFLEGLHSGNPLFFLTTMGMCSGFMLAIVNLILHFAWLDHEEEEGLSIPPLLNCELLSRLDTDIAGPGVVAFLRSP